MAGQPGLVKNIAKWDGDLDGFVVIPRQHVKQPRCDQSPIEKSGHHEGLHHGRQLSSRRHWEEGIQVFRETQGPLSWDRQSRLQVLQFCQNVLS